MAAVHQTFMIVATDVVVAVLHSLRPHHRAVATILHGRAAPRGRAPCAAAGFVGSLVVDYCVHIVVYFATIAKSRASEVVKHWVRDLWLVQATARWATTHSSVSTCLRRS